MSIIGMYDYDMVNYAPTIFNLDIMKLAQYYKNKRDIVTVTPYLDTEKYTKLIYRKDYYDGMYDTQLLLNPKVEYGGYAFTNDKQITLPKDIELLKPNKAAYESMRKFYVTNESTRTIFDRQMNAQHFRLSLDGQTIWKDWEKQLDLNGRMQTFIIHDRDLGSIDGSYELIKDFLAAVPNRLRKYVGTKFPIIPKNDKELLQWAQFKPMSLFYNIEYKRYYSDDVLYKFTILQDKTSISRQSAFWLTGDSKDEQDFVAHLPQTYKQLLYLCTHKRFFSLKYNEEIFEDKRWCRVMDLITCWYNNFFTDNQKWLLRDSQHDARMLISFVTSTFEEVIPWIGFFPNNKYEFFTIQEAWELLHFVKEACPELMYLMCHCGTATYKGGEFQCV